MEQKPGLLYPKNGALYLHDRIAALHVDIVNLIDTLVERDQRIAQLEAENAALKQASNVVPITPAAD